MAGPIHFPPPGSLLGTNPIVVCEAFGDQYTLYFDHTGIFGYTPVSGVTPPLPPPGFYAAGTVMPSTPPPFTAGNQNGTVILSYFDMEKFLLFTYTMTIAQTCPKLKRKPKRNKG
jgi:hypothetical protein